jgi:hypothetical protein
MKAGDKILSNVTKREFRKGKKTFTGDIYNTNRQQFVQTKTKSLHNIKTLEKKEFEKQQMFTHH